MTPRNTAVKTMSRSAKSRTWPSGLITSLEPRFPGSAPSSHPTPLEAIQIPAAPPKAVNRKLSASACRSRSRFCAPKAARTANSFAREDALVRSRPPMFEQAIKSTKPTAASRITSGDRKSPAPYSVNGTANIPQPESPA